MKYEVVDEKILAGLWEPKDGTGKFDGGQVTIIGGSQLFHGAPILALKVASRIASMVYFSTPEGDKNLADKIKANLGSFIWVPVDEIDEYIGKSDSVLIGPGMMRNRKEKDGFSCDKEGKSTREMTVNLFGKHPNSRWVIDGGSLQVISADDLPGGALITPNRKEFRMLFGRDIEGELENKVDILKETALKYKVTILHKDAVSIVTDGRRAMVVEGGNSGLIKGGTGDILAGLCVGFLAKNDPVVSAAAASLIVKRAGERLARKFSLMFNADDVADEVRLVYGEGKMVN